MLLDTILNEYYDANDSDSNPARASSEYAERVLEDSGVDVKRVRDELGAKLKGLPKVSDTSNKIMSAGLQETLKGALDYMRRNKDR